MAQTTRVAAWVPVFYFAPISNDCLSRDITGDTVDHEIWCAASPQSASVTQFSAGKYIAYRVKECSIASHSGQPKTATPRIVRVSRNTSHPHSLHRNRPEPSISIFSLVELIVISLSFAQFKMWGAKVMRHPAGRMTIVNNNICPIVRETMLNGQGVRQLR
ncbi:MAG: hypothetical protein C0613_08445 [Desulfobulbaceae bacterium]|nr:MAG: hypothetical protein C0613_08445 [Desulfobulbaceae bacterium]